MLINADKTQLWKADIAESVDFYNDWFMQFAPKAYRTTRVSTTKEVESAFKLTENLVNISPEVLRENPSVLPILRMATAPPIARDRLIGLAGVPSNLVRSMEIGKRIPPQMLKSSLGLELVKIGQTIIKLADQDILTWLKPKRKPSEEEVHRAATVVADRLCGAVADPIIRNAQEQRQLNAIKEWLLDRGYRYVESRHLKLDRLSTGTFSFRFNVPVKQPGRIRQVNVPIDAVIMSLRSKQGDLPVLIEAKSAGDFTNTNKRRKEEATKVTQLRATYGEKQSSFFFSVAISTAAILAMKLLKVLIGFGNTELMT